MTMLPTFLAGINWVMHTAGWLEGGLVACYEKYVLDVQVLEMLQTEFTPLEIDEASLAFDAHDEVRHGGHFLGAAHTMERFRTCFYRPFVNSSENYDRWMRGGAKDAAVRAGELARKKLDEYEAAAAGRRDPRGAGGLRHPPPGRAWRLTCRRAVRSGARTHRRPLEPTSHLGFEQLNAGSSAGSRGTVHHRPNGSSLRRPSRRSSPSAPGGRTPSRRGTRPSPGARRPPPGSSRPAPAPRARAGRCPAR